MRYFGRLAESFTLTGSGNIPLLGGVNGAAFKALSAKYSIGELIPVVAETPDKTTWQRGIGHLTDASTFVWDTFKESSTGNTISWPAGTKYIFPEVPEEFFNWLASKTVFLQPGMTQQQIYDACFTAAQNGSIVDGQNIPFTFNFSSGEWYMPDTIYVRCNFIVSSTGDGSSTNTGMAFRMIGSETTLMTGVSITRGDVIPLDATNYALVNVGDRLNIYGTGNWNQGRSTYLAGDTCTIIKKLPSNMVQVDKNLRFEYGASTTQFGRTFANLATIKKANPFKGGFYDSTISGNPATCGIGLEVANGQNNFLNNVTVTGFNATNVRVVSSVGSVTNCAMKNGAGVSIGQNYGLVVTDLSVLTVDSCTMTNCGRHSFASGGQYPPEIILSNCVFGAGHIQYAPSADAHGIVYRLEMHDCIAENGIVADAYLTVVRNTFIRTLKSTDTVNTPTAACAVYVGYEAAPGSSWDIEATIEDNNGDNPTFKIVRTETSNDAVALADAVYRSFKFRGIVKINSTSTTKRWMEHSAGIEDMEITLLPGSEAPTGVLNTNGCTIAGNRIKRLNINLNVKNLQTRIVKVATAAQPTLWNTTDMNVAFRYLEGVASSRSMPALRIEGEDVNGGWNPNVWFERVQVDGHTGAPAIVVLYPRRMKNLSAMYVRGAGSTDNSSSIWAAGVSIVGATTFTSIVDLTDFDFEGDEQGLYLAYPKIKMRHGYTRGIGAAPRALSSPYWPSTTLEYVDDAQYAQGATGAWNYYDTISPSFDSVAAVETVNGTVTTFNLPANISGQIVGIFQGGMWQEDGFTKSSNGRSITFASAPTVNPADGSAPKIVFQVRR